MGTTKLCCVCNEQKEFILFSKNKNTPTGYDARCKKCAKICKDEWNRKNVKHIKDYYFKNIERISQQHRERFKRNYLDAEWRKTELEKNRIRRKTETAKIKQRLNEKNRRVNNPTYRLRRNLSNRLLNLLRGTKSKKSASIIDLIGCSMPDFIKHLESTWQPGMNWNNYGNCAQCWQIDHIKPVVLFDLTKRENQFACYHYTNTQALWKLDNLSKSDTFN